MKRQPCSSDVELLQSSLALQIQYEWPLHSWRSESRVATSIICTGAPTVSRCLQLLLYLERQAPACQAHKESCRATAQCATLFLCLASRRLSLQIQQEFQVYLERQASCNNYFDRAAAVSPHDGGALLQLRRSGCCMMPGAANSGIKAFSGVFGVTGIMQQVLRQSCSSATA